MAGASLRVAYHCQILRIMNLIIQGASSLRRYSSDSKGLIDCGRDWTKTPDFNLRERIELVDVGHWELFAGAASVMVDPKPGAGDTWDNLLAYPGAIPRIWEQHNWMVSQCFSMKYDQSGGTNPMSLCSHRARSCNCSICAAERILRIMFFLVAPSLLLGAILAPFLAT